MDKLKYVKLEQEDGSYSEAIPLVADSNYVEVNNETLTNRLNKTPYYYNTVADMKADTKLKNGDLAITLGYRSVNDGGEAEYKITNNTNNYAETLNNSLKAELLYKNCIANVLCFGAYGDNTHNDTQAIQNCANQCATSYLTFYVPKDTTYKVNSLNLIGIRDINIRGRLTCLNATDEILIRENVNLKTPNIYICSVRTGIIRLEGLNSADVTIQDATKVILYGNSAVSGASWSAYNKFWLGFVRDFEINDDGTGTPWINENVFFGGRFQKITIDGSYSHSNNMFFKPLCEATKITINRGNSNHILDARLEGPGVQIRFGELATANVVTSNYASNPNVVYFPKETMSKSVDLIEDLNGNNRVYHNTHIKSVLNSINKYNNPKELTLDGDELTASAGDYIYVSDYIEIPEESKIGMYIYSDNMNYRISVVGYDSNKQRISDETIGRALLDPTPGVLGYNGNSTYCNFTWDRKDYWAVINPDYQGKYFRILVQCPSNMTAVQKYKNIDIWYSWYGQLNNEGYYQDAFHSFEIE